MKNKMELSRFWKQLEDIMPSLNEEPGYFKHNPYLALKLAAWIKRYQKMCDHLQERTGHITFTVFDLETTGLDSAHMFESGAAGITDVAGLKIVDFEYKGNKIEQDGTQHTNVNPFEYQSLSNPGVEIPEAVVNVTHITNKMVSTAPNQKEVLSAFNKFSQDTILVGHNIGDSQFNRRGFDIPRALGPISKRYYGTNPDQILHRAVDTLPMFQCMIGGVKHTNSELGERLGFKLVGAHRAMPDVRVNAIAFAKLAKIFYQCPVEQLVGWADARKLGERFNLYYLSAGADYTDKHQNWVNIAVKLSETKLQGETAIIKYYPESKQFEYPTVTKSGVKMHPKQSAALWNEETEKSLIRQIKVFQKEKTLEAALADYTDIIF